jgi:peptidoglycan/LPS O-acetylase OafA/YrhL
MKRLRELDFLRGVAILLVFLRHQPFSRYSKNIGWIGVDLFFVLSGFLVSGLLFKEYMRYGKINPGRFLIRRGFKIYPIYFLTYPLYLLFRFYQDGALSLRGIVTDLTFVQNYLGFGYAYAASWSLAVEEHFYIALTFLLFFYLRRDTSGKLSTVEAPVKKLPTIILGIIIACVLGRFATNIFAPDSYPLNLTMTHLRIDSLLAGVLISYYYLFQREQFTRKFESFKYILYPLAAVCLFWTPFIDVQSSFWVKTIGFSMLYTAFGIILIHFITAPNINEQLNRVFSRMIVHIVAKIGYCSYSIYIIHSLVNKVYEEHKLFSLNILNLVITSIISTLIGMLLTHYIEKVFLNLRDKYFASKSGDVNSREPRLAERAASNNQE